ncbi:hypothetical protein ACTXT7_016437 [Hymenolepis weldensis]
MAKDYLKTEKGRQLVIQFQHVVPTLADVAIQKDLQDLQEFEQFFPRQSNKQQTDKQVLLT